MQRPSPHLSRPVYEGLPWVYIIFGLGALVASYLLAARGTLSLLVGLLGGALISLLVISTTLAQGSYQITNLQQQDTNLARQEQLLSQQVAQASSPAQIAQEAQQLGMRQNPNLRFIDLKTGKIVAGKASQADAAITVPGYSP